MHLSQFRLGPYRGFLPRLAVSISVISSAYWENRRPAGVSVIWRGTAYKQLRSYLFFQQLDLGRQGVAEKDSVSWCC